jgi:hypothetical protein
MGELGYQHKWTLPSESCSTPRLKRGFRFPFVLSTAIASSSMGAIKAVHAIMPPIMQSSYLLANGQTGPSANVTAMGDARESYGCKESAKVRR